MKGCFFFFVFVFIYIFYFKNDNFNTTFFISYKLLIHNYHTKDEHTTSSYDDKEDANGLQGITNILS